MIKKIIAYGDDGLIVINKSLLKKLNLNENSSVKIETDGKSIFVTPITESDKEEVVESFWKNSKQKSKKKK